MPGRALVRLPLAAALGLCAFVWMGLVVPHGAMATDASRASDFPCFTDADLAQVMGHSTQTPALLYVWSPRMVLSVSHARDVQQVAERLGLDFVPLHDARVPGAEWHAAVQRGDAASALSGSQPLCAWGLTERDALRHFPTAFVVHAGVLHRHAIVGAMPTTFWVSGLRQRLEQP